MFHLQWGQLDRNLGEGERSNINFVKGTANVNVYSFVFDKTFIKNELGIIERE